MREFVVAVPWVVLLGAGLAVLVLAILRWTASAWPAAAARWVIEALRRLLAVLVSAILRWAASAWLTAAARWVIEALRRLLVSLGSLGRALSPVVVPVVAIAAYASTYKAWWVQMIAGAVAASLLWFLWFAEGKISDERADAKGLVSGAGSSVTIGAARSVSMVTSRLGASTQASLSSASWKPTRWQKVAVEVAIGVAIVAMLVAVVLVRGSGPVIWVGMVGFLVVTLIRLYGYATSHVRWVVVAVVGLICVRGALFVGWLPFEVRLFGEAGPRFWTSVAVPLVLLLLTLSVEAVKLHGHDATRPSSSKRQFRAVGFVLSFVAAGAFVIGMTDARVQTTAGTTEVRGVYQATATVTLADISKGTDDQLAWTYAPMLRLQTAEPYLPGSARDYITNGDRVPCKANQTGNCTKLQCDRCANKNYSKDKAAHKQGVVYYARVARGAELKGWPTGELSILLQYWIFYDYDLWEAHTTVGNLIQRHDADWEFVAVGLRNPTTPIFVALSAHCGGQLVPWDSKLAVLEGTVKNSRVEISRPDRTLPDHATSINATHPIVAVALGSHGNYADNSGQRPPDWGSCMHVPSQALSPLIYAANVRDETASADDSANLTQANDVKVVTSNAFPMNVKGNWGTETISFQYRDWPNRKGPSSPPAQTRSWANAVRSFLCDPYWTRDAMFTGKDYEATCNNPRSD